MAMAWSTSPAVVAATMIAMKIHGVERRMSWPIQVTRSDSEVRVRGATAFRFGDYGMSVPANRLILSVVDDVRLEIDVVAKEP